MVFAWKPGRDLAFAQMITNKKYKIKKIVTVWNDNSDKVLVVLPPCGVCRHYMYVLSEDALDIDIVLGFYQTVKLRELYPNHDWPNTEKAAQNRKR